jgi:hypothetical protein
MRTTYGHNLRDSLHSQWHCHGECLGSSLMHQKALQIRLVVGEAVSIRVLTLGPVFVSALPSIVGTVTVLTVVLAIVLAAKANILAGLVTLIGFVMLMLIVLVTLVLVKLVKLVLVVLVVLTTLVLVAPTALVLVGSVSLVLVAGVAIGIAVCTRVLVIVAVIVDSAVGCARVDLGGYYPVLPRWHAGIAQWERSGRVSRPFGWQYGHRRVLEGFLSR